MAAPPFPHRLVDEPGLLPPLCGVSIGYEGGACRTRVLADALGDYLPQFALSYSERQAINERSAMPLLRKAAAFMYATDKYQRRGEFGELLLHFFLAELYGTEPAISKVFFKDAANDTVKGFDCVHIVDAPDGLELWMGEAKFYDHLQNAIDAVVPEIRAHARRDYLRAEFAAVLNKIDNAWPHADALRQLIDRNASLDHIVRRIRIPVLLTYDSPVVGRHTTDEDPYPGEFRAEVLEGHGRFARRDLQTPIAIHLIFLPLHRKAELVRVLQEKLVAWQNM